MCDKCVELEKNRALRKSSGVDHGSMDQFTIDRIKMLIEELRAQEASLHP
jgi:hypothetical protein